MLSTLCIWIYMAFVSISIGALPLKIFNSNQRLKNEIVDLELLSLLGLALLTSLLGYISLFSPIGFNIHILIIILCSLSFFYSRLEIKQSTEKLLEAFKNKYVVSASLLAFVLICIQSVKHPFWIDIGGYHAQSIQWIENYGIVKGLANLHDRFGFNNSSHLVSAYFNVSFIGFPVYQAVTSYMLFIFCLWSFKKINQTVQHSMDIRAGLLISIAFILIYYRDWISSPSPDLVCTIYIIIVGYLFLTLPERIENDQQIPFTYVCILCLGTASIAVKISSLPIILLLFAATINYKKYLKLSTYIFIFILCFGIELPILIRNYYLSGYLIFPFHALDIFNPDWKIPKHFAEVTTNLIYNFSRAMGGIKHKIPNLTYANWLDRWFKELEFYNKIILITLSTTPIWIISGIIIRNKYQRIILDKWIVLTICTYLAVIFWFFQAPTFRFAHGFILLCFSGTIILFIQSINLKANLLSWLSATTGCVILLFTLYSIPKESSEIIQNGLHLVFLKPVPYKVEDMIEVQIDAKLKIKKPKQSEECWNEPLPCSPVILQGLEMRNNSLENGFRINSPNPN